MQEFVLHINSETASNLKKKNKKHCIIIIENKYLCTNYLHIKKKSRLIKGLLKSFLKAILNYFF
jgi:hypothetical protein